MDDELDNEYCIPLVCKLGTGKSINSSGYCAVICGDGLVGAG